MKKSEAKRAKEASPATGKRGGRAAAVARWSKKGASKRQSKSVKAYWEQPGVRESLPQKMREGWERRRKRMGAAMQESPQRKESAA